MDLNVIVIIILIATYGASAGLTGRSIQSNRYPGIIQTFHQSRHKRGAKIIGPSVLIGMRAVNKLVQEATRIPSKSPAKPKQFVKEGGYVRGKYDILSLKPSDLHTFDMPGGSYISVGRIGDRQFVLRGNGKKQKATLDIFQWKQSGYKYKHTDEIEYVE